LPKSLIENANLVANLVVGSGQISASGAGASAFADRIQARADGGPLDAFERRPGTWPAPGLVNARVVPPARSGEMLLEIIMREEVSFRSTESL